MTSWRYRDSRWAERLNAPVRWNSKITLAAVVAAILVTVGAAVIIARADTAEEIAADARALTWSESIASAGAALRAEVREGLVVGQSAAFGVLDEEATAQSAGRIREAIAELERRVDLVSDVADTDDIRETAAAVAEQAATVAEALEAREIDQALAITEDQLSATFEQLLAMATALSQESAEDIAAVNAGLGAVTTAARFVAALLIPALAVFLLYHALRRSQKLSLLRTELERERELRRNKDAFVAAASHHVTAPLSTVVGFAELLRDGSGDFSPAVRDEVIELIAMEAEETSKVVDDLLAAARYEVGDFDLAEERLEVRDVVDTVTGDWADTQRMKLTIRGNAVVMGDERWLGHAIRNLLRTATSSGGEEVEIAIYTADSRVLLEISDDGALIPTEENDRIAELYYSFREVDGLAPSVGLGLAVARRIAKSSGGDLRYARVEGKNVFRMTLPSPKSHVLPRDVFNRIIDPAVGMPSAEAIEKVIADGGPRVDYQPIVALTPNTSGGDVVGYEALARFESHTPTDWFIAAARHGLRVELELACVQAAIEGFHPVENEAFLTVNISDETVHAPQLADAMAAIAPTQLVFEFSETASIASYRETREILEELSASGVSVAIDHVGTGGLNLNHIAQLNAWIIKIDMALVRETNYSLQQRGLVKAVAAMAGELGAFVVAVGVETKEEHDELIELGIGFGQGHLYARPAQLDPNRLAERTT